MRYDKRDIYDRGDIQGNHRSPYVGTRSVYHIQNLSTCLPDCIPRVRRMFMNIWTKNYRPGKCRSFQDLENSHRNQDVIEWF